MSDGDGFTPDWTLPPGATIVDLLERRRIRTADFAQQLGLPLQAAKSLLDGSAPLTNTTARKLEAILGAPAQFWITREVQYRADLERLSAEREASAAQAWLAGLPVSDMVDRGWIPAARSLRDKLKACLEFFAVPDVKSWEAVYQPILQASNYRTSPTFKSMPGADAAWIRQGEILAGNIKCGPWNREGFKSELEGIRALTLGRDPNRFIPDLTARCAKHGVAVVVLRAPKGFRASGLTRFLTPNKALLLLSFRYLTDDQFWFTFFHEAGHLVLHGQKAVFIEGVGASTVQEKEADNFAALTLVPAARQAELQSLPIAVRPIVRFAQSVGVSPGVVLGQLQFHGRARFNQLRGLKRDFAWGVTHESE